MMCKDSFSLPVNVGRDLNCWLSRWDSPAGLMQSSTHWLGSELSSPTEAMLRNMGFFTCKMG